MAKRKPPAGAAGFYPKRLPVATGRGRFYGANLAFSANYMERKACKRLAKQLPCLGSERPKEERLKMNPSRPKWRYAPATGMEAQSHNRSDAGEIA